MKKKYLLLTLFFTAYSFCLFSQYEKNISATFSVSGELIPGTTQKLQLNLFLTNSDLEYGDSLALIFPQGVVPIAVSNNVIFAPTTEGQDPEAFNDISDLVVSWGDNNDSSAIGGIEAGRNYSFSVDVDVSPEVDTGKYLRIFISGDKMKFATGGIPRDFEDSVFIPLKNPSPDLTIKIISDSLYYATPENQDYTFAPSVLIINKGASTTKNFSVLFSDIPSAFQYTEQFSGGLNAGDSLVVTSPVIYNPIPGQRLLKVQVNIAEDAELADNTDSLSLIVGDSTFSKGLEEKLEELTISQGELAGIKLDLLKRDSLTSLSVFLSSPQTSDSLQFSVFTFDSIPRNLLYSSPVFIQDPSDPWLDFENFYFSDTIDMLPGSYFIAAKTFSSVSLGLSDGFFLAGTNFRNLTFDGDGNPDSTTWQQIPSNLMLQAHFGAVYKDVTGIDEFFKPSDLLINTLVTDVLHVKYTGEYNIYNMLGETMKKGLTTGIINIQVPSGFYIYEQNGQRQIFVKQ